jgi:hypothetical protein
MAATLTRKGEYARPTNDTYVVLLIISLVAMVLGCALLYFDYSSYPSGKAPTVVQRPATTTPAVAPQQQAPQQVQQQQEQPPEKK